MTTFDDTSELLEFTNLVDDRLFQPCEVEVQGTNCKIPLSWELRSGRGGPRTVVFGGIHGNEPCGVHAIRHLLQEFSAKRLLLESGSLVLAIGNEQALRAGVRYVGENMNRQFHVSQPPMGSDYERTRVDELKAILRSDITVLLDLHATSAPSVPYAMIERPFLAEAEKFQFETIVTGWGELGDVSVTGDTQTYAEQLGAWGITMENGQLSDDSSTYSAREICSKVLSKLGVTGFSPPSQTKNSAVFEMTEVYRLNRNGFRYARAFSNLEALQPGELIGQDEVDKFFAPKHYEAVMILPGNPAMLKPGDNLFHFGKRIQRQ